MQLPLKGLTVLEFSQYLSGPLVGLRLADLGARVIKIERPDTGDACRKLSIKDLWVGDDSLLFHTINRHKESYTANLKDAADLAMVKELVAGADVITHNFRPGIMDKLGLDYSSVRAIKADIIYTEITGYGNKGPWKDKPGQDLLLQSVSGLVYATGNSTDAPTPFGLSIADYLCGNHAVQGILAALVKRKRNGKGTLLQLSMLESMIDFQFEFFTTYHATKVQHQRSEVNNGHPLLSAPYGIYHTTDGYIAVAMCPLYKLADAIGCHLLYNYSDEDAFSRRDEIKQVLKEHFTGNSSGYWLEKMHVADIWAMPVLNWHELRQTDAYRHLEMEQSIPSSRGSLITTRCPVRINGEKLFSGVPAPLLGEHTRIIRNVETRNV